MPIKINGTNTAANPSITGSDTDTGIVYGSDQIDFSTGGSSKVTLNGSNLGVGVTSPTNQLHVYDGTAANDTPEVKIESFRPTIRFQDRSTSSSSAEIVGDNSLKFRVSAPVDDNTALTQRMILNSSGNLGVGTTSPSGKVHANSAANTATFLAEGEIDNPSYPSYGFSGQNADNGSRGAGMYLPADNTLAFATSGTERWKFDGSGNVFTNGLTTQVPGLGNTTTGLGIELQNGSIFLSRAGGASLYVNANNSGDIDLAVYHQNGVAVGRQKTQSNSLPSDQNVKKDIATLNLGLDFVNKLAPKQFRFNLSTDADPLCFGLIAQELETSLTSSGVTKNSTLLLQHEPDEDAATSDYWLDYSKLIPILINSVKELSTKVETLETEKTKLQTDLTALTARVAALEAA